MKTSSASAREPIAFTRRAGAYAPPLYRSGQTGPHYLCFPIHHHVGPNDDFCECCSTHTCAAC